MNRVLFRLGLLFPILLGCAQREAELSDFKPFTSQDGRYAVEFPGEPTANDQSTNTPAGSVTIHSQIVRTGFVEYTVAYADVPGSPTKEQIKNFNLEAGFVGARDGVARATKTQVAKETKITLDKWPGREWKLDATGAATEDFRWRCYYVKARQYQIAVGWQRGHEPKKEIVDRFLDSLQISAN